MRAYALLGEVEEDPLVLGAEAAMARLGETLDVVNREHAGSLLAPIATSGNVPEFGGIVTDLSPVYPLARTLGEVFFPLAIRVATAVGEIPLPAEPPVSFEGPAFDVAAELLYRVRKEDRLLLYRSEAEELDALANALALLLHRELRGWTERQVQVVRLYRRYGRQQTVGEELGVSQQAVSSALTAVGWKALVEAEGTLGSVFLPRSGPVSG